MPVLHVRIRRTGEQSPCDDRVTAGAGKHQWSIAVAGGGRRVGTGADAQLEASVRDVIDRDRGLREQPDDVLSTTFDLGHDELVLVKDIEVYSTCEHHLVPFHGVAHVGYIPSRDGRITGLSKIARLVDVYAKRPQVQERLTTQVADAMVRVLEPRGVIVVIECEHLCMSMRGVRKPGARTVTSAVRGALRETATRAEVMSLILKP